ncbi:MAG TPA: Rieske 2Fe-2S domain-containing protein [Thermomicrobiaceae bacterium]|nr:Rieske 2Fe-2S domain-containing protein [Thermomicrobiaceae bacterium]
MYRSLQRLIDRQSWLNTVADPLQKFLNSIFPQQVETGASQAIQNLLNGVWLGHPLHPMLTDVPVGAWTATLVLDSIAALSGSEHLEQAADLTLATGLAAALPAAVSGVTDWKDTYGETRTVGLLHGLTMAGSVLAYTAALAARRGGARSAGMLLSGVGYALMAGGAYLGGDEVFDLGYPVNQTAFHQGPGKYTKAMPLADLPENTLTKASAGGVSILLVKQGSAVYALDDTCVHAGCTLSDGRLDGHSVICPCHGSQFDLRDGTVLNGPATMPEPHYDVRIREDMIEVKRAAE